MSRNEGRFGAADETPTPEDEGPPAAAVSAQNTGFNWTTPTEFIELPSKGRYYPPGHPLHGEETLEIRYMTAKEEDILTDRALLKKGVAIDRAIQNLIVDRKIKINDLLVGDKNALIVAARITGYGEDYETKVTCPSCGELSEHNFDLSVLDILDVDQALEENNVQMTERNTFSLTLPVTKATIECKMLNGKDEVDISRITTRDQKANKGSTLLTTQLRKVITSVNGETDSFKIGVFVLQMPAKDSKYIRNTLTAVTPNVNMTQAFDCDPCGYSADMEVPLTSNFFWPK
jgi:rubrerythrin